MGCLCLSIHRQVLCLFTLCIGVCMHLQFDLSPGKSSTFYFTRAGWDRFRGPRRDTNSALVFRREMVNPTGFEKPAVNHREMFIECSVHSQWIGLGLLARFPAPNLPLKTLRGHAGRGIRLPLGGEPGTTNSQHSPFRKRDG